MAFLAHAETLAPAWGVHDCSLFPADWIQSQLGVDPAREWRGRYDDEAGAFAFIEARGGLVAVFEAAAASVGLRRTQRPGPGAVGVVAHPGVRGMALGAVCLGRRLWSTVSVDGGLWAVRARAIAAWEL